MDSCHLLFGRPWKYDFQSQHDGKLNVCTIKKDGKVIRLIPFADHEEVEENKERGAKIMMVDKKEFLQDMKDEPKPCFLLMPNPQPQEPIGNDRKEAETKKAIPNEVKELLDKYEGLNLEGMPKPLPLIQDIIHCINFIRGATLPNKATYKMTPQQNEEIAR